MIGSQDIFEFGPFRLNSTTRVLSSSGEPIALSSRAFDILHFLVLTRERIVTKDELLRHVWQGMAVDENNLAVQISSLRRALSDGDSPQLILTIPGRGYRFVGDVTEPSASVSLVPAAEPALPVPVSIPISIEPERRRSWNLGRVLAIAVVALAVLYGSYRAMPWFSGRVAAAPRLSIVVMPFRNLSNDPEEGYLADAVSDDLTTDLSHLPRSVVIARMSADAYKGRTVDAGQIGHELGVRYLLEGSLRRAGDRILINAQLIETETGAHLWAERFDVSRQELSETQTTIVRHIASALDFTLVQVEGQRSLHERPNDPDAVDLFFRARSLLDRDRSLDALQHAQTMLEQSLKLQPDFVDAASELTWVYVRKSQDFDDPTDEQDMSAARQLIDHFLQLAPQNPRILAARGAILRLDGKCSEAVASYELALTFDANDVDARTGFALCSGNLGHLEDADQQLKEVLRVDPQDPGNWIRYEKLGLANLMLGRGEEAVEWLEKARAGNTSPDDVNENLSPTEFGEIALIAAYGLTGRLDDAKALYRDFSHRWFHRTVWRISSYFTKADASLPGFRSAMASLAQAGMPEFADEGVNDQVPLTNRPTSAHDFDPTPVTVPGITTVMTSVLAESRHEKPEPLILDVGHGAAVIPEARWIGPLDFPSATAEEKLRRAADDANADGKTGPIVIMSDGPYGWDSYNAALSLIAAGHHNILWYRGGEEAWAAAGLPAEDRRDP